MAKVLVTGGAGFIGSHTVAALVEQGHEVRILDCLDPQIHGLNPTFPSSLKAIAECIQGDVCDFATVEKALNDIDAVFHFAALTGVGQSLYDIRHYVTTNCDGTATLLDQGDFRVGDIHSCFADQNSSKQMLGYEPTVSLQTGLVEFVA